MGSPQRYAVLLVLCTLSCVVADADSTPDSATNRQIIAAADKLARPQLRAAKQRLRRAVVKANTAHDVASAMPIPFVQSEHANRDEYKTFESRSQLLAAEGLGHYEHKQMKIDRVNEKKDKTATARKKAAHRAKLNEKEQKTTAAIRLAKHLPDPFQVADHTMSKVLTDAPMQRDSLIAKRMIEKRKDVMPRAEKTAEKVYKTSAAMYTAVKEKVKKSGMKRAMAAKKEKTTIKPSSSIQRQAVHTIGNSVHTPAIHIQPVQKATGKDAMKLALHAMQGVLDPQKKLVQEALQLDSTSAKLKAQGIEKQVERTQANQAEILKESELQNTRVTKDARIIEQSVKSQVLPIKQAAHKLILSATKAHLEQQQTQQKRMAATQVRAAEQKKLAAQQKKLLMPKALSDMHSLLKPIKTSETLALDRAAKQLDRDEADKVRQAVLAAQNGPDFSELQREVHKQTQNDLHLEAAVSKQPMLTKTSKDLINKVRAKVKAKRQEQKHATALLLTEERKHKSAHREIGTKAIGKIKRKNVEEVATQNKATENAIQEESSAVHAANSYHNLHRGKATQDVKQWLRKTSRLRKALVTRAIEDNAQVGETAQNLASTYIQHSQQEHAKIDTMVKQETDWQHMKLQAKRIAKLKLKAREGKVKQLAQSALAEERESTHDLLRSGSETFSMSQKALQSMSQKVLQNSRQLAAEAKQKKLETVATIMGKAHEAQSKISSSAVLKDTKKAASELVHKVPAIKQKLEAVEEAKKMRQTKEISTKTAMAFTRAKEKSQKTKLFVTRAERHYQTDPAPMKKTIKRLVKQYGVKNPKLMVENEADARKQEYNSVEAAINRADKTVNTEKHKIAQIQGQQVPSWSKEKSVIAADEFVKDEKYEHSRDARYDSLMQTFKKP